MDKSFVDVRSNSILDASGTRYHVILNHPTIIIIVSIAIAGAESAIGLANKSFEIWSEESRDRYLKLQIRHETHQTSLTEQLQ